MKTQALVVADDPVYLSWLQGAAGSIADFSLLRPADAEDLIRRVQGAGRADLVLFQFDAANAAARATWMERLLERLPDLAVAGLGEEAQADAVLMTAWHAGARDFFVLRRDDDKIVARIGRLLRRGSAALRAERRGRVYALLSADPDPACAFTAEHLALATLSGLPAGERVVLVDLAQPAGAAAIFLNITQTYSVLDAINDVHRCDQTLVDSAFARHSGGLYVLSLPEDQLSRSMLDGESLLKLLQMFRGLFAASFVTLDGHMGPRLLSGVIGSADRTLLLSDPSILRSRRSKYLVRALRLEDTALDRVALVVDTCRRRHGLEPEALSELLELPLMAALAGDEDARLQAMNTGEPLFTLAPKDPWCRDLRRLASALASGKPLEREQPGLLDRIFS